MSSRESVFTLPHPPRHLFKYRTLQGLEFTRKIVAGNELFLSAATSFNDPFDSIPGFSAESSPEERDAFVERMLAIGQRDLPSEDLAAFRKYMRDAPADQVVAYYGNSAIKTASDLGVCCFSELNDAVLMWSHYANNHSGICLRFSVHNSSSLGLALKVIYSPNRPLLYPVRGRLDPTPALLTKAAFWSYEREWRIVAPGANRAITFPPQHLDGIIFGARISASDEQHVRSWVEDRSSPVELLRAVPDAMKFELKIVPADE